MCHCLRELHKWLCSLSAGAGMFLHQQGLQGSPGRSREPLPQSPTIRKPPRPLLWRVHPQLGALEKKSFASAGTARAQGQPGEEVLKAEQDFGPGCGLQNEPCRALLVQLWLLWLLVLFGFCLPGSPPWTPCCQKGWMGAQELLIGGNLVFVFLYRSFMAFSWSCSWQGRLEGGGGSSPTATAPCQRVGVTQRGQQLNPGNFGWCFIFRQIPGELLRWKQAQL